jgi:hypothetical protein
MVDPKDSTNLVEVRKRIIYEDIYQPQIPLYFYNGFFGVQPYRPLIIQRPIVIPRRPIVVPTRPSAPINRNYSKPLPRNKNNRQPR